MIKNRVITATCLAGALCLLLFFLPVAVFQGCLLLVIALAAFEWAGMTGIQKKGLKIGYALLIPLLIVAAAVYLGLFGMDVKPVFRDVLGATGIFWALSLLWVLSYPASSTLWGKPWFIGVMGFFVMIPPMLALYYLLGLEHGRGIFLYLVALVAAADIGAYFSGKKFGRRKLAPKVSPGKSWAGFIGGLGGASLFAVLVSLFFIPSGLSVMAFVAVSLVAILASVLGDLLESMVKRHVKVKDSGSLLPGHGGMMDRIDSLTAAAPVFTLLVMLL